MFERVKDLEFLKASQVAALLGPGWSRQRVHVELGRGTFIEPATRAGNIPLWTMDQMNSIRALKGLPTEADPGAETKTTK